MSDWPGGREPVDEHLINEVGMDVGGEKDDVIDAVVADEPEYLRSLGSVAYPAVSRGGGYTTAEWLLRLR